MQKVLSAAEMREVDRLTTERYGIPSIILMENAANAVAKVITDKLGGSVEDKRILILCGKGNNGGDGAAIGRILWKEGAIVEIELHADLNDVVGDARTNFEAVRELESWPRYVGRGQPPDQLYFRQPNPDKYLNWTNTTGFEIGSFDVLVDAMFGTGLSRGLDKEYSYVSDFRSLRDGMRLSKPLIVSVDIPSGLASDFGYIEGPHVSADLTVTFTAPKQGNIVAPAARHNGELVVANIGSPPELIVDQPSQTFVSDSSDVSGWMHKSEFTPESYKNKRGHALLIAGSENYAGAAILCGNAAIRSGVGLVTIGTPRSSKDLVGGRVAPEVMVRPLAETESGAIAEEATAEIEKFSKNIDAMAIGAGLSAGDESTGRFVRHFVENRSMPTLLDADALTLMAPFERVSDSEHPVILTPHEGEFMRLLGTDDKEAIKDRVAAVRKFAQEKNVILVLKGERNLIGHPDGRVVVNPTGNPGLGKAGNGDTLLGILAGFVAQAAAMKIDMFETIVAGVYVAGLAGDIAAEKFGKRVMTATDTRDCLGEAFRRCENESRPTSGS